MTRKCGGLRLRNPRRLRLEYLETRKLLAAGSLDLSFGIDGKVDFSFSIPTHREEGYGVAIMPDGRILAAGRTPASEVPFAPFHCAVARVNPDGSGIDQSFGDNGTVILPFGEFHIAEPPNCKVRVQDEDKLLVFGVVNTGFQRDFGISRLNADGSMDSTFGEGGTVTVDIGAGDYVHDLVLQDDGKIILIGTTTAFASPGDFVVVRLNVDGTLDSAFGNAGKVVTNVAFTDYGTPTEDTAHAGALQADGRIVVGGSSGVGLGRHITLARYNPDGSLDTSFASQGFANLQFEGLFGEVFDLQVPPGGQIVVSGAALNANLGRIAVIRFNENGELDLGFNGTGYVIGPWGIGTSIELQRDEKIIVASSSFPMAVLRYAVDGSLDPSFGIEGHANADLLTAVRDITLQPDGKIVAIGDAGTDYVGLLRFLNDDSENVNDDPIAGDDAATTPEDTPVTIAVLDNDSDADGDDLAIGATSDPTHGSIIVNGDDTITYTPDDDYHGTDSFTYTVSDGNGGEATATVTVTVMSVNDEPTAGDDQRTTPEDSAVTVAVLANDGDVDGDDLVIVATSDPMHGSVIVNGDNTITYTPDDDFHGTDLFTYTISDGQGGEATATVTITVDPVNDDPTARDDAAETGENVGITVAVLDNDEDVDGDDLSIVDASDAANGTVVVNADGTITYTPDGDFSGTDSFTYTVSDGHGGEASATVVITILPEAVDLHPWHNEGMPWDVDANAAVTANDLLEIVRMLRERGNPYVLPPVEEEGGPPPYVDVNADGLVSVADLLEVVQRIRADQIAAAFGGEGESDAEGEKLGFSLASLGPVAAGHERERGWQATWRRFDELRHDLPKGRTDGHARSTGPGKALVRREEPLSETADDGFLNEDLETLLNDIAPDVLAGIAE